MDYTVGGRYLVVAEPIRGGQAVVYEGRDTSLDRRVAIKFQNYPVLGVDPLNMRARLERERVLLGRINHRNVVKILDAGIGPLPGTTAPDHAYIVMDFVEGRTVHSTLRMVGRLEVEQVESITMQLLGGLGALHSQSEPIIHRDVNATNVMVGPDGTLTLLDLGIAKATSSDNLTSTGSFVGTMKYASPEQLRGLALDARSDLYSVGCLMYQMLTGTLPFRSDDPAAMHAERQNVPTAPSLVIGRPELRPLDQVVLRALAPSPADRFASAAEMLDAVAAASVLRRTGEQDPDAEPTATLVVPETKVEPPTTTADVPAPHRGVADRARLALVRSVDKPRLAYEGTVSDHIRGITRSMVKNSLTRGVLIGAAAAVIVGLAILGAL